MKQLQKVLILGAKGMLGQELARVFSCDDQYLVAAWDREEIDVTDFTEAGKKIEEVAPDIIFNTVAYNAVDLCETNEEEYTKALVLNRDVPGFLAEMSKKLGSILVHYSTDYVFDGKSETGYDEEALPNLLSRYGETKLAGERGVLAESPRAYVIRLSKLFGKPGASALGKRSFFDVMLEKGQAQSEVQVVDDERSCFTYAPDLAEATKALIEDQTPYGIYHLPNEGEVTWYEAVQELYRLAQMHTKVIPVTSAAFPRPAKRPQVSTLLNTKRPKLRPYQEALAEYLQSL